MQIPLSVSVIATVFNEIESIDRLLDSLAEQSRPPDEIVIVDGGSEDGTVERMEARSSEWAEDDRARMGEADAEMAERRMHRPKLLVIHRPGANISEGRNIAIDAARGPVIAVTDAGVRLPSTWLEDITRPFDEGLGISSGFFVSAPEGVFETALGAVTLPDADEIDPSTFLPSSRSVAFTKEAWKLAGGYPEWLDYCEDLVFDFRLIEAAGPARFVPEAAPRFRPRPDLRSFFQQYYRYARGDGKANLWWIRHGVRYATYLLIGPFIVFLGLTSSPWFFALLGIGLAWMGRRPLRRLRRQWSGLAFRDRLSAFLLLLPLRVIGDLAKMVGYPMGWLWRLRTRPPEWRPRPGVGHR